MKARYAGLSPPIWTTTTAPEPTCRWGKTRPSHARFRGPKSGQLCPCVRSVGCITATNDKQPELSGIYSRFPADHSPNLRWQLRPLASSFSELVHRFHEHIT